MKKRNKTQTQAFDINNKIVVLSIIVLSFLLYGKSISNGYNIDDDYVIENHELAQGGVKSIPKIFTSRYHTKDNYYFGYRPLTVAIFAIEYDFFINILGIKAELFPHIAHFFNIIYYILCCSILFLVLKTLFKTIDNNVLIAFISTIIFLAHPIHSEVVLSLKNREEILMLFFSLLSFSQSLKYYETRKLYRLGLGSLFLALGFLAKESAVVFLAIIPFSILFFKTNYKIININLKLNKGLFSILFVTLIVFVLSIQNLTIFNGEKIDNPIQIFNYRYINTLTATVALMLLYNLNLIYVLVTKKIPFKDFIKNKFFILGLILVILTPIIANNTITLIFFCVLTLHIYSISKKSITKPTNPIITLKKHKKWIAPLAISVLALSALIIIISLTQKNLLPEVNAPVHKWQNPIFERTQNLSDKIGIALYSLGFYLKLIFIPYPLRFYYGYKMVPDVDINNVWVVLSLLIHIGLALWALKSFNKRKLISYAIIFYLIAIIPFSNIVFPLTGIIAERLLFIASIGFSIAFSIVVIKVSNSIFKHNITKQIANTSLIITLLICIPAAAYTINRNLHWKDRISLYKHDIQFLENSAKANNLYANLVIAEVYEYMKIKKDPTEKIPEINLAIKHYEQAIKIDSTYLNPMHNLGYIYLIIARNYEKAKIYFDNCIELDSTLDEAYLNRGMANYYLKNYNQSINDLEKHYKFDKTGKNTDKVFYYIGLSYLAKGDTTKANTNLLKTLEINDVSNVVIADIKETFVKNNNYDLAIKAVDILIKRVPNADINYVEKGNYYLLSGDTISAIENWEIAFEKYNGNFNIAMTLSQYWREQGNIEKAEYFTNKAIEFRKNQNTQQY
ncbi:MAG: hypothetical protein PHF99_12580 [Bacteroidales bacterium]|nr:hypothetical protein [Bacteroidales bacterium]